MHGRRFFGPALLLLVVFYTSRTILALNLDEDCQTPDGKKGTCTRLRSCEPLRSLLERRNYTDAEKDHIRQSKCGVHDGAILACCPLAQRLEGRFGTTVDLPKPGDCGAMLGNRIVGGTKADLYDYPWLARLQYYKGNNRYGFHCGGVLIHKQYVLTAAHCIESVPSSWTPYKVRLGEYDAETKIDCEADDCADPVQDILISAYIVHQDYFKENGADYNDITLVRLAEEARFTASIQPICLPMTRTLKTANLVDISMVVAGWGQTLDRSSSRFKQYLRVRGWNNEECAQAYSNANLDIIATQLCAGGEEGKDSCRGDSGGPLMRQITTDGKPSWYLTGLVSFGLERCGTKDVPGVYTRIGEYMDWILESMVQ